MDDWQLSADGEVVATCRRTSDGDPVIWLANESGPWWRRAWKGVRLIFGRATRYELTAWLSR